MKRESKAALFLELAKPDHEGFSRSVSVAEFVGRFARLRFGNGGDWCRRDSSLAKTYNVVRRKRNNAIVAVELQGFNKTPTERPINATHKREIKAMRCVVLGTSSPECDHRDGRLDDPRLSDTKKQRLTDFQPLSKAANAAKRQHCKNCRETGQRYDAKQLGFKQSQIKGNGQYRGTCVGCYWHDPRRFHGATGI